MKVSPCRHLKNQNDNSLDHSFCKHTLRKLGVNGIVVNLHGRVGVGPCESYYVVATIVNLGQNVADGDVFGAQVVIEKQFSTVLKENKGNYLLSTPF